MRAKTKALKKRAEEVVISAIRRNWVTNSFYRAGSGGHVPWPVCGKYMDEAYINLLDQAENMAIKSEAAYQE